MGFELLDASVQRGDDAIDGLLAVGPLAGRRCGFALHLDDGGLGACDCTLFVHRWHRKDLAGKRWIIAANAVTLASGGGCTVTSSRNVWPVSIEILRR